MSYDLMDWFIDAMDRGCCLSCKSFALERMGNYEAQCYSCGRWYSGFVMGFGYSDLIHDSTTFRMAERQRSNVESYEGMKYVERMSQSPDSYEDYGDCPEDG